MNKKSEGYFWAILSGILYGAAPIMILGIVSSGASTNVCCLMIRYIVTSVILFPFALYYGKRDGVSIRKIAESVAAGGFMSLAVIGVYTSYYWLPAGVGMAISYLYPLVILLINICFFHKKLNKWTVGTVVLYLIGTVLLCDVSILPPGAWTGILFGMLSALAYAGLLLWEEKRNLGEVHPIVFTEILSLTCVCCLAVFNLATNQLHAELTAAVLPLFILVGVVGALATTTQLMAVNRCGALYTSVLGTLELVVCCLGGAVVLRERFSIPSILGAGFILITDILTTIRSETP